MDQILDKDNVGYSFRLKFFTFIYNFVLPEWKSIRAKTESYVTE